MRPVEIRSAPIGGVVVGIRQELDFPRSIVEIPRERIAETELQSGRQPAVGADLERVVLRSSGILRETDDAHAAKRPKGVGVDPGIGLNGSWQQLVDVALSLIVVAA